MSIGNSAATIPVDSFIADVLPGFDDAPSLSKVSLWQHWRLSRALSRPKAGMSLQEMHGTWSKLNTSLSNLWRKV